MSVVALLHEPKLADLPSGKRALLVALVRRHGATDVALRIASGWEALALAVALYRLAYGEETEGEV